MRTMTHISGAHGATYLFIVARMKRSGIRGSVSNKTPDTADSHPCDPDQGGCCRVMGIFRSRTSRCSILVAWLTG